MERYQQPDREPTGRADPCTPSSVSAGHPATATAPPPPGLAVQEPLREGPRSVRASDPPSPQPLRRSERSHGPLRATAIALCCLGAIALLASTALVSTTAQRTVADGAEPAQGALADGFTVWERNSDGSPVRFDPCTPVDVVFAPQGAPAGARQDLEEALARVADATGLDLRLTGTTDEPPSDPRLPYQPERYGHRWAPVLVTWATPGAPGVPLRDIDRGVATPVAVGPEGDRSYVTGQVVLNAERDDLRAGFGDRRDSWGATLLHELAHLVGLGHVDDPDELMYTFPGEGPVTFGPGDRAGLAAVGAAQGCRDVPPAAPVPVRRPAQQHGPGGHDGS